MKINTIHKAKATMASCITAWCLFAAMPAHSANLAIWPIDPRINADALSTNVWVKNNDPQSDVVLQARVLRWRQDNNTDIHEPQNDIVVSPPTAKVKPGDQQLFRLVNRSGAVVNVPNELSYRIIVDEIPSENSLTTSGLSFQMRYSLPLFVGLPAEHKKRADAERHRVIAQGLAYRLIDGPKKSIEIHNRGKLNARLSRIKIMTAGNEVVPISDGLWGYVLVGASKQWPLTTDQWQALTHPSSRLMMTYDQRDYDIAPQ